MAQTKRSVRKDGPKKTGKARGWREPAYYVLPKREIESMVANIPLGRLYDFVVFLHVTYVTAGSAAQGSPKSHLALKELAREGARRDQSRFIEMLLAAIKRGPEGVIKARMSILYAMKSAYEYVLWGGDVQEEYLASDEVLHHCRPPCQLLNRASPE
jgi:hypothetical protein